MKKAKKINEKRLAAYTAAAGAALLAASPANAAVQYTEGGQWVSFSNVTNYEDIDLDLDGNIDISFGHMSNAGAWTSSASYYGSWEYFAGGFTAASDVSFVGSWSAVNNLGFSAFMGDQESWTYLGSSSDIGYLFWRSMNKSFTNSGATSSSDSGSGGYFGIDGPRDGYVGINFYAGGAVDDYVYGWIHVTVDEDFAGYTINGWAYEDSGEDLHVGDIGVVPEPSSMALFAAGAAGLFAFRKRKNKK